MFIKGNNVRRKEGIQSFEDLLKKSKVCNPIVKHHTQGM